MQLKDNGHLLFQFQETTYFPEDKFLLYLHNHAKN